MKKFIPIFLLLLITGCGDSDNPAIFVDNLFFQSGNDMLIPNDSTTDVEGLWQSEMYEDNGLTQQIRWELSETETTLAKKCTDENGAVAYVQVSLPLSTESIESFNSLTPFNISTDSQESVTDIALMSNNRPCRIAMDPTEIATASVIASDSGDFTLSESDLSDGIMELTITESNSTVQLRRIGF
jgi:hypothetical protein